MPTRVPLLSHPAETELFGDALTCEAWLPAGFRAGEARQPPAAAESLLHALAIAEDARGDDTDDRKGEPSISFQRLEAKVDLLMNLVGKLARQRDDALPLRGLRWSHLGLRLDAAEPFAIGQGEAATALIEPASWLSDYIELPARVLATSTTADGQHHLWLRFAPLGAGLADALERHLFRLHRRQIAEARLMARQAD
ncbi:PilZ domain-containing protein [Pseudoxanthomonas sp. z9]|uniref:PilZ domain-containing protein n=1 Tax=Pseudoxanthomonas sp. z9 TaxID=2584942 RepID=UPI001141905B|nr:PilZ domain-containing protein [Pseudoxanthomonas sp. z9]MCL6711195.1 PilZ domain-containing protein [Pseudomonas sp. R2.Fl]